MSANRMSLVFSLFFVPQTAVPVLLGINATAIYFLMIFFHAIIQFEDSIGMAVGRKFESIIRAISTDFSYCL